MPQLPRATARPATDETTYSVGAVARITGLTPELLRAWERRYHAVTPLRSEGGTRLYRSRDLERLRRIKAAVDAGHRISRVAGLEDDALAELFEKTPAPERHEPDLEPILTALEALDAPEAHRQLSLGLATLGPARFARLVVAPLSHEIGKRWSEGRLEIGAEHLATGVLRTMLGAALQPSRASLTGPRVLFATPSGERHELGLQIAALSALGAGALPIYLGADVPVASLVSAAETAEADAVALGIVTGEPAAMIEALRELRERLPAETEIWVGGPGAKWLTLPDGVDDLSDLDALEHRVALLRG